MKKIAQSMVNFLREEEGATAVEYGLMVALIAAVVMTSVALLGTNTDEKFNSVAEEIGK